MGKTARFDSGAGGACYAAVDIGSDEAEIWLEFRMWSNAAAVAAQAQSIWQWANGDYPSTPFWQSGIGPDPGPFAYGPILVEWHYDNAGDFEVYHDGVLIQSGPTGGAGLVRTVGLIFPDPTDYGPLGIVWVDDVKIGTTRHGTELFSDDFEDGTFAAWTDIQGDATVVDSSTVPLFPMPITETEGRVLVALDDGPLEWAPDWACVEFGRDSLVAGFDISRGRQSETETTDAATATVYLNDTQALFDPANIDSPFFGKIDGAQIALQVWDPVGHEWVRQFRGRVRGIRYDFHPGTRDGVSILSNVEILCVDMFAYLARVKMVLGVFGATPTPAGSEGAVYYGEAPVDDRIVQLLIEAELTIDWYVVFTGNVDVQAMLYDAADVILTAIRDACDAEFPGIANCYTDRIGRFVFHGRAARFDPDSVAADAGEAAWPFRRWPAGDGAAILLDPTRAQIRTPLRWERPTEPPDLVNSAYCTPRGVDVAEKSDQVVEDSVSIAKYGRCPWQAEGLIIAAGTTTSNTAAQECAKFAEHYVENRKDPRTRVSALTLLSIRPTHPQAEPSWGLLLKADIADIVELDHSYPGFPDGPGGGFATDLYIEGMTKSVRRLNPEYDMVEATFAVSPADTIDVFS